MEKTISEILEENEFREAECCFNCIHLTYKNTNPDPDGEHTIDSWCKLMNNETFTEWVCNKFLG